MEPCLTFLSDEELKRLHTNALDILENVLVPGAGVEPAGAEGPRDSKFYVEGD